MSKFRLHTASHSVQRLRITHTELAAAGIDATFESVLEPATWKDALGIEVGAEVEVVGPSWARHVRVLSVGPAGATVEHIAGQQSAPVARHLFVCRAAYTEHMYVLIERKGDAPDFTYQHLMPGQSNFGMLVEEVIRVLEQGGELPDVTLGCHDVDLVKEGALANEDPLCPTWHGKTVFCPEGGGALADRWNAVNYIAGRGSPLGPRIWCAGTSSRFHVNALGEKIRKEFASETGAMDWRRFERGRWDELQVRPRWTAKEICPDAFPKPPAVPREIEEAAADKREELRILRNPQAYRESRRAAQQDALREFEEMSRAKAEAKAKAEAGTP